MARIMVFAVFSGARLLKIKMSSKLPKKGRNNPASR
jgi:hypothetical protein